MRPDAPRLVSGWSCPICGGPLRKPKPIYGVAVCRHCCHALANRRQAAWLVDYLVFTFALTALEWFGDVLGSGLRVASVPVAALALPLLFKDVFKGMSPGKLLCGVQVVHAETQQPTEPWRSVLRNLPLYAPLMLEFWIGAAAYGLLVLVLLHAGSQLVRGQRLGDKWAGTKVVWRRYAHKPPFDLRGVLCMVCGYDLTGNVSGVCPECGTTIERRRPARQSSTN